MSNESTADTSQRAGESFRPAELATFFRLSARFWRAEKRWLAWSLGIGIVVLTLAALFFQLRLNAWNRDFFDAVERRDWAGVTAQLSVFVWLVIFGIGVAVAFVYARMTLQVRWREWVTMRLLRAWMTRGHAYQLDIGDTELRNPEYRIASDIRITTELFVEFVIGFLSAALMAVAFAGVLLTAAGAITVAVGAWSIVIPGYMVLAALLYSLAATALMFLVGRPLVPLTEAKNQAEAEFLFALTRAREAAEGIALAGGEPAVRQELSQSLGTVIADWLAIMRRQMGIAVVSNGSGVLLPILPLLLLAPKYLTAEITLGQMMQLAAAFVFVVASLNWFFDNFQRFAEWNASVNRVAALEEAAGRLAAADAAGTHRIRIVYRNEPGIVLNDVSATFEDGRVLIADADVTIAAGERVLLVGDTGVGKSTLVRAIAGIWPWGSGTVTLPKDGRIVVVPQTPYLPPGTLATVVAWPQRPQDVPREEIVAALEAAGLSAFPAWIDEVDRWDQVLTDVEKQRLGLARVFLQKPDVLILDDATSAVDEDGEARLYAELTRRFPHLTLLSIGQRASLERYHDRKITLAVEHDGGARMKEGVVHVHSATAAPDTARGGWRGLLRRLMGRA
jgi:putative ATP-binding cassette transporter